MSLFKSERNRQASLAIPLGVQRARERDFATATAAMRSTVSGGREPALAHDYLRIVDSPSAGRSSSAVSSEEEIWRGWPAARAPTSSVHAPGPYRVATTHTGEWKWTDRESRI